MTRALFVFESTHMAFWAEEVAGAVEIPAELVPAPPESHARCDLALETFPDRADELDAALRRESVSFRRWRGARPPDS